MVGSWYSHWWFLEPYMYFLQCSAFYGKNWSRPILNKCHVSVILFTLYSHIHHNINYLPTATLPVQVQSTIWLPDKQAQKAPKWSRILTCFSAPNLHKLATHTTSKCKQHKRSKQYFLLFDLSAWISRMIS